MLVAIPKISIVQKSGLTASNAHNPLCLFSDSIAFQEDGGTHIKKSVFSLKSLLSWH